ncbi:MAG: hypothetical protein A2X61_14505 [Ignavibacteria bacterium GWB2_35_12]|nr:MAG: hypothetical protein A2X63_04640 [Ignavibacteria bacterium GWA2_35_8]OGU41113.1 MAG: hypothetical protein A2X61_14505 [Ignavibacteria bacterium GWB2_35_12]OGU97233.1 MAG: hypothetical protein A2220_06045 [Ignavibacteria bacterium RIFOXYA2_FULL_35_10]OGV22929.1 MAG: hypothetical protein A2475_10665 [Ignavibacteria bacterium RIFOXYC2_FULL_35_21]
MEDQKYFKVSESLIFIGIISVTGTILYLYGYSDELKFNFFKFLTINDYINISVSFFTPILLYVLPFLFLHYIWEAAREYKIKKLRYISTRNNFFENMKFIFKV